LDFAEKIHPFFIAVIFEFQFIFYPGGGSACMAASLENTIPANPSFLYPFFFYLDNTINIESFFNITYLETVRHSFQLPDKGWGLYSLSRGYPLSRVPIMVLSLDMSVEPDPDNFLHPF